MWETAFKLSAIIIGWLFAATVVAVMFVGFVFGFALPPGQPTWAMTIAMVFFSLLPLFIRLILAVWPRRG
jgi:hypothetical protein